MKTTLEAKTSLSAFGGAHSITLRFADYSTTETSGTVCGVHWEFGPSGARPTHVLDLHILKDAPADVILSDSLLLTTKAFSQYNCYLVDDEQGDEEDDAFFAINVARHSESQGRAGSTSAAHVKYAELVLRGEKDDEIIGLQVLQQAEASTRKDQRRTNWDKGYAQNRQLHSQLGAQLKSALSPASSPISGIPSSGSNSSLDQQPSPGKDSPKSSR